MSGRLSIAVALVCWALICQGCSVEEAPAPVLIEGGSQQDGLEKERREKDELFRSDQSPLPQSARAGFQRLSYFPVDPQLRFSLTLNRHQKPQPVRLATNTGEIRTGLRYGWFDFRAAGRSCRLQVYRIDDSASASLFIPFRDATSGTETYAAGRYVDLQENTSGVYNLDFNRAYNPWCAYSDEYSCPRPPEENTLEIPIRAGEKNYASIH